MPGLVEGEIVTQLAFLGNASEVYSDAAVAQHGEHHPVCRHTLILTDNGKGNIHQSYVLRCSCLLSVGVYPISAVCHLYKIRLLQITHIAITDTREC